MKLSPRPFLYKFINYFIESSLQFLRKLSQYCPPSLINARHYFIERFNYNNPLKDHQLACFISMSSTKIAFFMLLASYVLLLIISGDGLQPVEAMRIFVGDLQVIMMRTGFVFQSKQKGALPGLGPSGCHHGPGGGNGHCPQ